MKNPIDDEKTIKIRKDVIKNVAIVFLIIMLLLTFFSNSIMNKSLPEVAVKYIESGSVSEKIRGTGMVEADDPYSVMVTDSRKISGVAVSVGDDVEKDQVLFYLEDSESEELQKAEAELEDLILKYTQGALTGEMSASAYNQATTGQVSSMGTYEARIEAAKNRVKAAQEAVDAIDRQIAASEGTSNLNNTVAMNQAQQNLKDVQTQLADAEAKYNELKGTVEGEGVTSADVSYAALEEANAKAAYEAQKNALEAKLSDSLWSAVQGVLGAENASKYGALVTPDDLYKVIFDKAGMIKDATALNDWAKAYKGAGGSEAETDTLLKELTDAYKEYVDKQSAYMQAKEDSADYNDAKSKLNAAKTKVDELKNKQTEIENQISQLTNDKEYSLEGEKLNSTELALKKIDAQKELSKADEDLKQLLTDISKTLDLANQNSIIKEQQEKINKLRADAVGATVTAPVAGRILSLNKSAGESTTPAEALATIQVAGKAMTLKIAVTDEQAKKVTPGQEAELQNAWYYNDIGVKLQKILPDPESQGKKKILVFNVSGDVVSGANLSISMGQRARDYDKVVPNSAIREDNKGKFIFVVEQKGTPFGTRYKAKRIDVEVLTSDDNISAIQGEIDNGMYTITTSDKPVNAGMQVRLSDN